MRPRLSDWLVEELRSARGSVLPPPPAPLESSVEATQSIDAPLDAATLLTAAAVFEKEERMALPPEPMPESAAQSDDDVHDDEQRLSRELAESLSYAHEETARQEQEETAPLSVPPVSERTDTAVYASATDWLDDSDEETSAFFASAPADEEEAFADDVDGLDEPLTEGASLSPQVLTAGEDEHDDEGAFIVPGTGGSGRWKSVAALAAALLLVFLVVHRFRGARSAAATASQPVAAANLGATGSGSDEAAIGAPAPQGESETTPGDVKKGRGGGFADGLGRTRAASTDSASSNPAIPGGPSVARFPDLPREILNQLEQVFQSDELKHGKSATDSVERYTR